MLYVGVDSHTKTSYLTILDEDGRVLKHAQVESRAEEVKRMLGEYEELMKAVLEAHPLRNHSRGDRRYQQVPLRRAPRLIRGSCPLDKPVRQLNPARSHNEGGLHLAALGARRGGRTRSNKTGSLEELLS